MASVTYDERSFRINGERIWLTSGSIDYFRVPADCWRDRLLKAKGAGLNCVATRVAWNFHEPSEGQWDFSGDKDVVAFVRMAKELGLYVILRPGPYIGADWDFGGLPGWLAGKSAMAYRTNNAAYTHYYDKYFGQLLPRLTDLQVTRGGNILLIQNEQSYHAATMPDRTLYLEFINQLFRRSGFDIPTINCNDFTDPPAPDSLEAAAGGDDVVQKLKLLRWRQPNEPALVVELHTGGADNWGARRRPVSAATVARRALEAVGCGAQVNYHMWHGGTNFGFWGGRRADAPGAFQTTSYDCDAPLAEGGGMTDKYYLTRLVNLLSSKMAASLAACGGPLPAVTLHDWTALYNLTGPSGRWAIVTNNGRDEVTTARLAVPGGRQMTVSLAPLGAVAVPIDLVLGESIRLDYANLMPLGLFGDKTLVLHGPEGWPAEISVNDVPLRAKVPAGGEPKLIEHQGLLLVLVNSALASRTWWTDESLVFGAAFVGEGEGGEEIAPDPAYKQCAMLSADGKLTHRKPAAAAAAKSAAPRLSSWRRVSVCTEPADGELTWQRMDRPQAAEKLGVPQGYVWYRAAWDEPAARHRKLFLPDCDDRAMVYVNGELVGLWGRGDGATRLPMRASLRRGRNVLVLLADNLGRTCAGARLGEAKGLFGQVYDAAPITVRAPKVSAVDKFPRRIIPRHLVHLVPRLEATALWQIDLDLPLRKVAPVHLSVADVPHDLTVLCNDRVLGIFPSYGTNYVDLTITVGLKRGRNLLRLLAWGAKGDDVAEHVRLHSLAENLTWQAEWSWRAWQMPQEGGPVVGKDQPAWYAAKFRRPERDCALFVHVVAARKGQLFLNGHNVGRFWTAGPQDCYYLPACWMAEENQLLLFVESGDLPRRTRLEYHPSGPYRT